MSTPAVSNDLAAAQPRSRWQVAAICALLASLVLAVFARTVSYGFVNYDDDVYVYQNPVVSQGFSLSGARWAFTHVHAGNWHPLTTILHMLDCQVYGLWPGGHHLTNVWLHATGAVLLFLLLIEMTGAFWRSAFVATVFAIHPLRVESVAWISELKDVLSGVFFMLTLLAYIRSTRRPGRSCCGLAVIFWFALGLMSKPMLVTVPFLLFVLDYWPLRRFQNLSQLWALVPEKTPLFVLSALSCTATILAQQGAIQTIAHVPFSLRLGNAAVAYVIYLEKFFCPASLAILYPLPENGWPWWEVTAALLALAAITAGAFILRRRQPFLIAGWLWYLGMLVPVIGILQVGQQACADRYTYLPEIGLCLAVTWAAAEWAERRHYRKALVFSAVLIPALLLPAAIFQTSHWRNNITLWVHTIECTDNNAIADNNLGLASMQQGHAGQAIPLYRAALQINPALASTCYNLGIAQFQLGHLDEAILDYHQALQINPALPKVHKNLGLALLQQGKTEAAAAEFREALESTESAEDHNNLGMALLEEGRTGEAIAEFRASLRIDPAYRAALLNLHSAFLKPAPVH